MYKISNSFEYFVEYSIGFMIFPRDLLIFCQSTVINHQAKILSGKYLKSLFLKWIIQFFSSHKSKYEANIQGQKIA
jgi:hypothetical protein